MQFCNCNSTIEKKKINCLYRQQNFVSVKVPVKINRIVKTKYLKELQNYNRKLFLCPTQK